MESRELPHFEQPPLVETVIGAQFGPIDGLTSAHLGAFWNLQRSSFPVVVDAPALPALPSVEADPFSSIPMGLLRLRLLSEPAIRVQMFDSRREHLLQLQNGRLVLNWRRVEGVAYPRFDAMLPKFEGVLKEFQHFIVQAGLPRPIFDQWELVYVNHIERGLLWNSVSDWPRVVPGLLGWPTLPYGLEVRSAASNWRFSLPEGVGLLDVDLSHGRAGPPDAEQARELMVLQLNSRGVADEPGDIDSLSSRLGRAHRVVVTAFADMTSSNAHQAWRRVS